jgi:hypothetical protein
MLTDTDVTDIARVTGSYRSAAAAGGIRGLAGPCCGACASGMGDDSATGGTPAGIPRWLFLAALGLGAIASGVLIYDRFAGKKRAKRRRGRVGSELVYITPGGSRRVRASGRGDRSTAQLPVETMSDVVFGRRT